MQETAQYNKTLRLKILRRKCKRRIRDRDEDENAKWSTKHSALEE
jgi:hypothetical protein